jgi:hypothetical protein
LRLTRVVRADAVSIIDGFTRIDKEKYDYVDTKCLIFNVYDDALDFLKRHPRSCLTRAGDREGFKVTPPYGEYFRVDSNNRNRYKIIYEYFVIKIPCSIEDEKNGRTRIAEMATKKEGAETDYDIVISYVRSCLCCSCSSLKSITPNLRVKCDKHPANYCVIFDGSEVISVFNFVVGACALRE